MLTNEKGSALITVLVVLFILITAFFTIYTFAINRIGVIREDIHTLKAGYLASAGINRFQYMVNSDSLNWQKVLDLEISEQISEKESFKVSVDLYGCYLLVKSTGQSAKVEIKKKAILGIMPDNVYNSAIINHSQDYPLTLSGRTKIIGNAFLGPHKIIGGSFEGRGFQGTELVDGRIVNSAQNPKPKIDTTLFEEYLNRISDRISTDNKYYFGSVVLGQFDSLPKNYSSFKIENSLEINSLDLQPQNSEIVVTTGGNIIISGDSRINGLVQLISDKSIIVENDSNLKNVILFANDSIIIKDNSIVSGQLLSKGKISITDSAKILNPSLIYSYNDNESDSALICYWGKSYSEAVSVSYDSKSNFIADKNNIFIDTNVTVAGLVYSHYISDIRGSINGITESDSYRFIKPPTVYINWLIDINVDRSKLSFIPILPISFPYENGYAILDIVEQDPRK
ncbi:MAG: hypothetical protein ABIJ45_12265 [Candidatus Zixiibacteriota bacterium]